MVVAVTSFNTNDNRVDCSIVFVTTRADIIGSFTAVWCKSQRGAFTIEPDSGFPVFSPLHPLSLETHDISRIFPAIAQLAMWRCMALSSA